MLNLFFQAGMIRPGVVRRVMDYGVFVDMLGGLGSGLVPTKVSGSLYSYHGTVDYIFQFLPNLIHRLTHVTRICWFCTVSLWWACAQPEQPLHRGAVRLCQGHHSGRGEETQPPQSATEGLLPGRDVSWCWYSGGKFRWDWDSEDGFQGRER